jgi:hypothetical protein
VWEREACTAEECCTADLAIEELEHAAGFPGTISVEDTAGPKEPTRGARITRLQGVPVARDDAGPEPFDVPEKPVEPEGWKFR